MLMPRASHTRTTHTQARRVIAPLPSTQDLTQRVSRYEAASLLLCVQQVVIVQCRSQQIIDYDNTKDDTHDYMWLHL
jgi:hypothetical protein